MAFLVPDVGLLADITDLKANILEGCSVGLFTTNHTPAAADVLATYSAIEASWTGYARQTASGWTTPAVDGSHHALTYSPTLTFTVTAVSGVTVYGYFVVVGGVLHHAELISPTITPVTGTPVTVILRYWTQNP